MTINRFNRLPADGGARNRGARMAAVHDSRMVRISGETMTVPEALARPEIAGMTRAKLVSRYADGRRTWEALQDQPRAAITWPIEGVETTIAEMIARTGYSFDLLRRRLEAGARTWAELSITTAEAKAAGRARAVAKGNGRG